MIDIRVLGTLEIHRPDGSVPAVALTQPKRLALLLYLALAEPAGYQSRESLMALLWPEADDESARHSLRNALYGLRQTLGEAAFVTRGEGYLGLEPGAVCCDALEVRRLLAGRRWEEATAAWGGDLVPGFHVSGAPEFERWLDDQRTSLRRAVTDAAWRRVDELERSGEAGLVPAAQRAWALDPRNEAGARRLIGFLDSAVGRAAALRAYDELADYLRRECETEPSAETRALIGALKARIEPQASRTLPASPPPPEPSVSEADAVSEVEPSGSPVRRRTAGIGAMAAAVLLALGLVSVFGREPGVSATTGGSVDSMTRAEREGVLRLAPRYRRDTSAYGSYLRGLAMRFKGSHIASRDTFAMLVERDPLYAPGLSGLAHAYALITISGEMPPAEGWPKVEVAAHKAIALDSTSASAYLALGGMEMFWRWNLPRAGELIDKALALEPDDPEAHAVRGAWFRWRGEVDSAVVEAQTSYRLDPLNSSWSGRLARQLYLARRYGEAATIYRRTLRDYPARPGSYGGLSDVYRATGHLRDALAMRRAGLEVDGDSVAAAQIPIAPSEAEAARAFADMALKQVQDYERRARQGDWIRAFDFAAAYAEIQDRDATLRWLDSMRMTRDPMIWSIPLNPVFDFLRSDPRYLEWETKLPWRHALAVGDTT